MTTTETTETTEATFAKYDPNYNVYEAATSMRSLAELLRMSLAHEEGPDPSALSNFFESMHDHFLYTLGWLENQRTAADNSDDRLINVTGDLMKGVYDMMAETHPVTKKEGLSLSDVAGSIVECSYALEELAKHMGISAPAALATPSPLEALKTACIEAAKSLADLQEKLAAQPQLTKLAAEVGGHKDLFERMSRGVEGQATFDEATIRTLQRVLTSIAVRVSETLEFIAKFSDSKSGKLGLYALHTSQKVAKLEELTNQATMLFGEVAS